MPRDLTVCTGGFCNLNTLTIPVVQSEMDGYTFQCVNIDYQNNTQYLGELTVLEVIPPPSFITGIYNIAS